MLRLSALAAATYRHTGKSDIQTVRGDIRKITLLIMLSEMGDHVCSTNLNSHTYSLSFRNNHAIFKQTLTMMET